jgi:hypothetical protein
MRKQLALVGTLLLVAGTALAAGTGNPARDAI